MELSNLRAFLAAADSRSFSLAAEQLHLTQPAISKRIAALENQLNVRLFDRLGRRVMLTEAGQTLRPKAAKLLLELEDCRRALSNLSGQINGRLVIATSHHIGLHRLPPLLRHYTSRYPEVQLDMRFIDSEIGCTMISEAEAELAIVTLPLNPQPQLLCQVIWDDPLAVMVQRNHPLANQQRITLEQISQYPAILPGEITFTRRIIDRFFQARELPLAVAFSTNYLETIKMMVSVGLGWSILPASMQDCELTQLPVDEFRLQRSLGVVRHREHTLSNAARAMLQQLNASKKYPAEDSMVP